MNMQDKAILQLIDAMQAAGIVLEEMKKTLEIQHKQIEDLQQAVKALQITDGLTVL